MKIQDYIHQENTLRDVVTITYIDGHYEDPNDVIRPLLWDTDDIFNSIHEIRWMIGAVV